MSAFVKPVSNVMRRELAGYFSTPVAWVFIVIFLVMSGVFTFYIGSFYDRGIADLDGEGEVVGGVVVMRWGENALATIDGVKARLAELERSLPDGVEVALLWALEVELQHRYIRLARLGFGIGEDVLLSHFLVLYVPP